MLAPKAERGMHGSGLIHRIAARYVPRAVLRK